MSPLGLRVCSSSSHTSHPMCLSPADLSGKATIVWYFQVGEEEGWDPSKLVCPTWWTRDASVSSTERGGGAQRTRVEAESWQRLGHIWPADILCCPAAFLLWFFCRQKQGGAGQASLPAGGRTLFSALRPHLPKSPICAVCLLLRL